MTDTMRHIAIICATLLTMSAPLASVATLTTVAPSRYFDTIEDTFDLT